MEYTKTIESEWEIWPDPGGKGRGWTAIRIREDKQGPYEEWCGFFTETYDECERRLNEKAPCLNRV